MSNRRFKWRLFLPALLMGLVIWSHTSVLHPKSIMLATFPHATEQDHKSSDPEEVGVLNITTAPHDEGKLLKRTDPFLAPEWFQGRTNAFEYQTLEGAIEDVRAMIHNLLVQWDATAYVRARYWPQEDWGHVFDVYQAIMATQPGVRGQSMQFTPVMGRFRLLANPAHPVCSTQAQPYAVISNQHDVFPPWFPNDPFNIDPGPWAACNICPRTFDETKVARRRTDRRLSDFMSVDGTYHLHWTMDTVALTLIHEKIHFEEISKVLPWPTRQMDAWRPGLLPLHSGDFYTGLVPALVCLKVEPGICKNNADSYAWYATYVWYATQFVDALHDVNYGVNHLGRCEGDLLPPVLDTLSWEDLTLYVNGVWHDPTYDPAQIGDVWP